MNKAHFIITFGLLLALPSNIQAQAVNLDSLWSVWDDSSKPALARSTALKDFIYKGYLYSKPDSALFYSAIRLKFATKNKLTKEIADSYNLDGIAHALLGKYQLSLRDFKMSLDMMEELKNDKGIAIELGNLGNVYKFRSDYANAVDHYTRSLAIREELGDSVGVASSLNNIGILNDLLGNLELALENYRRCLAIYRKLNINTGIARALTNLALIHEKQGNHELAIDYNKRSIRINTDEQNLIGLGSNYNNLGLIYLELGDAEKSITSN